MKNKTIKVQDVMKVIDVYQGDVSQETADFLYHHCKDYTDNVSHEDLYNIHTAIDGTEFDEQTKEVQAELKNLHKLAVKHDASYVRLTA